MSAALKQLQGKAVLVEEIEGQFSFTQSLAPYHRVNLHMYELLKEESIRKGKFERDANIFSDLEQKMCARPRQGTILPTLMTHNCMWSHTLERMMLPKEFLCAQGFRVFDHIEGAGHEGGGLSILSLIHI